MKNLILSCIIMFLFISPLRAEEMPGLKTGDQAPEFAALNFKQETVKFSKIYKTGPVVLIFYRGSWCPYCNTQLQELQSRLKDFKKYNASIVAVSVDKIDYAAKMVESNDLEFEIISNPEGDILKKYGLVYKVPDEINKKYKKEYKIDLEAASGRTDHVIAIPATYVINQQGIIVFAYANKDYKIRTSSDEILQELKKLTELQKSKELKKLKKIKKVKKSRKVKKIEKSKKIKELEKIEENKKTGK